MLEAIRNLGILKMINELEEFDYKALLSVDSFLKQRHKAIENGRYAKLQFEPINEEKIGIFENNNGKMKFTIEKVSDDNWKYLFLKTASQGTYITPTWKESQSKLRKTVEKYKKYNKSKNVSSWLKKVVDIFESEEIEINELDDEGNLLKKPFFDTMKWVNEKYTKKNKIKVFSVVINGKYNAEIKDLLDSALEEKPKVIYQTEQAKAIDSLEIQCSLCKTKRELYPNVLAGVGINIANVDKIGFFSGISSDNAVKAFPICAPCAEALYAAKFHVFKNLTKNISEHLALIIPHIIESEDIQEALKIISSDFGRIKIDSAERTEAGILKDLAENKGISTVTFIFGDIAGQSISNIRKVIPNVIPSRLSEISKAINEINNMNDSYSSNHPWKNKYQILSDRFEILKASLGVPKYSKQKTKGKRQPYKSSKVHTLELLNAIFLKREYSLKSLLAEFSSKLSYDFLGALSDEDKNKPIYSIKNNIANMVHLLLFLNKLEVIKMEENKNYVSKYLEKHEGLKPLNDFLSKEAKGLNSKEKLYAFLVGLLFGKLVSIQLARGVSANALKWLKGLQISSQDLMDIFINTRKKLDDYSTPNPAWSDEMKGVAEAIGSLGADIEKMEMSGKEIPYYLCLGQSLSTYYLPKKEKKENQKKEDK